MKMKLMNYDRKKRLMVYNIGFSLNWSECFGQEYTQQSEQESEMEGARRKPVNPWLCSDKRVVAKKRPRVGRVDGFFNSIRKLQWREISSKCDRAFTISDAQERFRNICLHVHFVSFFFILFSGLTKNHEYSMLHALSSQALLYVSLFLNFT